MSFEENWANATVGDGTSNLEPPGEGQFDVKLLRAGAFTSKAGNEVMTLEVRVIDGEHEGYEWTEMRNFKTQGAANAAKATADRLGVDVEAVRSMADLDAGLRSLAGKTFVFNVERNGEYLNVYVSGEVYPTAPEPQADPGPETGWAPIEDEDIPFLWDGVRTRDEARSHVSRW